MQKCLLFCFLLVVAIAVPFACNPTEPPKTETPATDGGQSDAAPQDIEIKAHQRDKSSKFIDEATKISYDGLIDVEGGAEPFFLMGTGVRIKIIVHVYAMGLYLEPKPAQKALLAWKGKTKDEIGNDQAFYDAIMKGKFGKSLRLVMVRDVDKQTFADAFKDSLEPRIKKLLPEGEQAAATTAMETFKGLFDEAKDRQVLLFTWHADGKLDVFIDGTKKGTIDNAGLALCFFDIYIGTEPISGDAKKNFADGMTELFP